MRNTEEFMGELEYYNQERKILFTSSWKFFPGVCLGAFFHLYDRASSAEVKLLPAFGQY